MAAEKYNVNDEDFQVFQNKIAPILIKLRHICEDNHYTFYAIISMDDNPDTEKYESQFLLPSNEGIIKPSLVRKMLQAQLGLTNNNIDELIDND
jgi:hypothetical protein